MQIKPTKLSMYFKTGELPSFISPLHISAVLGFEPRQCDDGKATMEWVFTAGAYECAIWDYYDNRWSTHGPQEIFDELFGKLSHLTFSGKVRAAMQEASHAA